MRTRTIAFSVALLLAPVFALAQVYTLPDTITPGGNSPAGASTTGAYKTPRFTVLPLSGLDVVAIAMVKTSCTSYTLTWGDGTNDNFTAPNPCTSTTYTSEQVKKHNYAAKGTYTVTFVADGVTDTRVAYVGTLPPMASSTSGLPSSFGGYNPNGNTPQVPYGAPTPEPIPTSCTDEVATVCARPMGCVDPASSAGGASNASCQLKKPENFTNKCKALIVRAVYLHDGACTGNESFLPGGAAPGNSGDIIPMQGGMSAQSATGGTYAANSGSGSSSSNSCPVLTMTLRRGSSGGQVTQLQQFLASRYNNAQVTGYFGALTHQLVVQFQSDNGIPPVGIVGPLTRAKIAQACQ